MARAYPVRIALLFLAMIAVGGTLAACSDDDDTTVASSGDDMSPQDATQPPEGDPTFSGTITNVSAFESVTQDCIDPGDLDPDGTTSSDDPPVCSDPKTTPLGTILLEEFPDEQRGDKISLRIARDVPLFRDSGSGPEAIEFDGVSEGDTVDVWVSGPVDESYPMQGAADAVVVRG